KEIRKDEGDTVESQELLGIFEEGASAGAAADGGSKPAAEKAEAKAQESADEDATAAAGPAARKLMAEHGLDASRVEGSGKGGRITREDVEQALKSREQKSAPSSSLAPAKPTPTPAHAELPAVAGEREERRVPMTRLRKRVAERLVDAQHTAAILTTFNEVNMKPIMDMRKHYQSDFEKAHGVRLGFMSFFVRACVEALKRFPVVNASIDGDDVVYHGYYDIGVAVSSDRGLVVPVLRDADQKGLAEIESQI